MFTSWQRSRKWKRGFEGRHTTQERCIALAYYDMGLWWAVVEVRPFGMKAEEVYRAPATSEAGAKQHVNDFATWPHFDTIMQVFWPGFQVSREGG